MSPSTRPPSVIRQRHPALRRRTPNAVVASVAVMTGRSPSRVKVRSEDWQAEAWRLYDVVGELRNAVEWKASALSRVNLIAAVPPAAQGDEPTPIDVETADAAQRRAVALVGEIAGGPAGQGQLLAGVVRPLTVAGVAYVTVTADPVTDRFTAWRSLSNDEVRQQGDVTEIADAETGEWSEVGENDLLIKVWRPHPRRAWQPDSAVRACRGVLHEIEDLSKRVSAEAKSRLTGNGLLVLPTEVEFPRGQGSLGLPDDGDGGADDFVETMMAVADIAMEDQESTAATLPLVIRVPAETVDKVQHITFWGDFSAALDGLRDTAIKRLALGLDMPPEVLLGLGDTNHWSAWQIAEEAITLHIEPPAETICHAITTGFLRAALQAEGFDPDAAMVWYDTPDLTTRPDRSAAASEAHSRIKLSDEAYLRYLGLDVDDMPDAEEMRVRLLLDVAKGAPTLAPAMLAAAGFLPVEVADAAAGAPGGPGEQAPAPAAPDTQREIPDRQASAALVAAADGLVTRALEVAGRRLQSAAGRGRQGGAAAVQCDDPSLLHTSIAATEFASLDHLLGGVWDRVPTVAARQGVDAASLVACLDGYVRALIANGHAHDWDRLAAALGAADAVHAAAV